MELAPPERRPATTLSMSTPRATRCRRWHRPAPRQRSHAHRSATEAELAGRDPDTVRTNRYDVPYRRDVAWSPGSWPSRATWHRSMAAARCSHDTWSRRCSRCRARWRGGVLRQQDWITGRSGRRRHSPRRPALLPDLARKCTDMGTKRPGHYEVDANVATQERLRARHTVGTTTCHADTDRGRTTAAPIPSAQETRLDDGAATDPCRHGAPAGSDRRTKA